MSEIRDAAVHFEGVKISLSQDKNGLVLKLSIHPDETPKDIILDPLGTRYMVALVKLGDDDRPVKGKDKSEGDKAVAIAGLLCRNERFRGWMADMRYSESEGVEDVAEALRKLCGVNSRADLATNEAARALFMDLRDEFERDYKRGSVK